MFFHNMGKKKSKSTIHDVKVENHKTDVGVIPIHEQKLHKMKTTRREMESEKRKLRKELKEAQKRGTATPEMVTDVKLRLESIEEWLESELLHRVRVIQSTLRQ